MDRWISARPSLRTFDASRPSDAYPTVQHGLVVALQRRVVAGRRSVSPHPDESADQRMYVLEYEDLSLELTYSYRTPVNAIDRARKSGVSELTFGRRIGLVHEHHALPDFGTSYALERERYALPRVRTLHPRPNTGVMLERVPVNCGRQPGKRAAGM